MDRYEVVLAPAAYRALSRLPSRYAWAVARMLSGPLAAQPARMGKPLTDELAGRHAARCGNYRIVYRIDESARRVEVERIDHRADVYRPR